MYMFGMLLDTLTLWETKPASVFLKNASIISFSGRATQIQKPLTTATFFFLRPRHLKAAGSGSPCCTRLKNLNFSPISAALVNIL